MAIQVLYEDNHLLVVAKPAGSVVQGALADSPSLLRDAAAYVKLKYAKPGEVYLGVVSRLDKPVTGIVPFARTSKAAARLSEQFRNRSVEKKYLAIVQPTLPTSEKKSNNHLNPIRIDGKPIEPGDHETIALAHWLVRDDRNAITRCYDAPRANASQGILRLRCLKKLEELLVLEIELETGRKHQIRAQLASVGLPIVGDEKYGSSISWKTFVRRFQSTDHQPPFVAETIGLHCNRLSLTHPTLKTPLTWSLAPDWPISLASA